MSILSPNMGLILPTINVDSGLVWEGGMNSNSAILDGHNHAPGSGIQIGPSGININGPLPFQNNAATSLAAATFTPQASYSVLNSVYCIGADLYYTDGSANIVQITSGGTVNATSSGISSGTATASFVSSVLVVNAASTTPANIQGGSLLLGNNSAGSKFLTLAPPNAMAANYSLTLPILPAATSFLTIDTSGNISGSIPTAVGQQISASSGAFFTHSTSLTPVTNLSVTITSRGNPICVFVSGDGTDGGTSFGNSFYAVTGFGTVALLRGATIIMRQIVSGGTQMPGTTLYIVDPQSAGTYTYSVQVNNPSGNTTGANQLALYAYELL